ncbi:MAG: hypothetical protein I3J02_07825 [Prevotella sp.]|nr:hypothetical protein [Prevotella sp.]
MRKLLLAVLAFCALCWACDQGPTPDEVAAQAAKTYYDLLIQGKYDQFVDGRYQPDSIPASYREQLLANAKMFVGEQQEAHRGIREVRIANAKADTAHHVANVFLVFVYGDSTNEEILVPMVEHKGVWYTR